ncbi:MAG: transposase, partial [Rhodospirillales bacterium]|nr:transposase [Rhodospirillales bacterium]
PFLLKLYADAGYQGPKFQRGLARVCRKVNVGTMRRCATAKFVVLSRRWIVERTIAWLNRRRRLSKEWEWLSRKALAFLRWAIPPLGHSSVGRQFG